MNSRSFSSLIRTSDEIAGSGSVAVAYPGRTLLVVDDDASVREALWITFRELYTVRVADSGLKALEIFRESPPDVTVLDIRMPGMSGLDVLREIKQLEPSSEVILLSAFETVEYVRQAMRLGACDYITKPFEVESLRAAVSGAMDRRDTSRKTAAYDERLSVLQKEMHHQQVREELARTRNEIYASIIHDLNGPLTVIAGYVELMQRSTQYAQVVEEPQLSTLRSHSQAIYRQVTNCIELSRRYLGFLEGKVSSNASIGIKEVLFDVAELLKAHPHARANELIIHPLDDDVVGLIHGTDLLQVLLNLTINALQCSPQSHKVELYARVVSPGMPKPFLNAAPGTRLVRAPDFPEDQPLISISVQDNGPGISESLLKQIFEPYFTTKAPGKGTGLGLSIVQRLVLQAKGAVHVFSHLGEGTVFTIYIPLETAAKK